MAFIRWKRQNRAEFCSGHVKFALPPGHTQAEFRCRSHWHAHGFQSHEKDTLIKGKIS